MRTMLALETKSGAVAVRKSKADEEAKSLNVPFEVKAESLNDEARTFTGLASTWDLDLGGDVIHKGAFKKTLADWKRSKSVLPLLDSHSAWGTVRAVVGKMVEAKEADDGLEATFEVIDGPDGDEIWRRIKGGYVTGLSIGYRAVKIEMPSEEEQRAGVWRHLKEVALKEVSVVVWPMNPSARIDKGSVKALAQDIAALEEAAAGRELTDEEKAELVDLQQKIAVLLEDEALAPGDHSESGAGEGVPPAEKDELKPDDPARVAAEEQLREAKLRTLGTRANRA